MNETPIAYTDYCFSCSLLKVLCFVNFSLSTIFSFCHLFSLELNWSSTWASPPSPPPPTEKVRLFPDHVCPICIPETLDIMCDIATCIAYMHTIHIYITGFFYLGYAGWKCSSSLVRLLVGLKCSSPPRAMVESKESVRILRALRLFSLIWESGLEDLVTEYAGGSGRWEA